MIIFTVLSDGSWRREHDMTAMTATDQRCLQANMLVMEPARNGTISKRRFWRQLS